MKACERYLNAINELVDGTLGPLRRAELDLHLESCDGCRALAADLQQIAHTARSLEPMAPPAPVWTSIAGQLQKEGRVATARSRGAHARYTVLALAAALVLAIGASLMMLVSRDAGPGTAGQQAAGPAASPAPSEGNATPDDPVQGVASELALSDQHLQNAVDEFYKTAGSVDPETRAKIQANLLDINQAIAETQAVIQKDPQSVQARQSLYQMLKQKIEFLQDTIALMNAMRHGDAEGAAQIVEGKS